MKGRMDRLVFFLYIYTSTYIEYGCSTYRSGTGDLEDWSLWRVRDGLVLLVFIVLYKHFGGEGDLFFIRGRLWI